MSSHHKYIADSLPGQHRTVLQRLTALNQRVPRSIKRFLVTGITAVAVDAATYSLLLIAGLTIAPAKAAGFTTGAIFAYFANRYWTFDDADNPKGSFIPFMILYLLSMGLNVTVNGVALLVLEKTRIGLAASWFIATGSSATLNYFGMRFIVFRKSLAQRNAS